MIAATEYVTPAIEIIDARIEQFDRHTKVMRKVFDTISDNAANAGIVVGGGRSSATSADPLHHRPSMVRRRAAPERRGGRDRPGRRRSGPPRYRHRVAGAQTRAPGASRFSAGQIVLAGSFTRPVAAKPGDLFEADYGPLGCLTFKFV